jgi:hypothetical protein
MGAGRHGAAIGVALAFGLGGCFQDEGPMQASGSSAPTTTASGDPTSAGESASTTAAATSEAMTGDTTTDTTTDTTGDTTTDTTTGGPSQVRTCPNVAELVLCYEFEDGWTEDYYLHDSSATAHHGLMEVVTRVPGHAGSAAALTAESSVYASYDEQVFQRFNDGFTIAAWINPSVDSLSSTRGIVERDGHVILGIKGLGDTYKVVCSSAQAGLPLNSETDLAPDEWNHVACVYDGSAYSLWINGEMEGELAASIAVLSDDPLHLGNDGPATAPSTAMIGMLDEVQLWEIPLKDAALCTAAGIESCGAS